MSKESIVFVAPTESLEARAKKVIDDLCLSIPVICSTDKKTVRDVQAYPEAEVLISRGGLAVELRKKTSCTVIEIGVSAGDILRAVRSLHERGSESVAIVMRANILFDRTDDFEHQEGNIYIRPCQSYRGIEKTVMQLEAEGKVDGIVGCRYAVKVADREGIPCEYADSDRAAIMRAIDEARRIVEAKRKEQLQNQRLTAILQNVKEGAILLDGERQPLFWNAHVEKIFHHRVKEDFLPLMEAPLRSYRGEQVVELYDKRILFRLVPVTISEDMKNELVLLQEVSSVMRSEHRIRESIYQKGLYARYHFSDIFTESPQMKEQIRMAKRYAARSSNVLIQGESGTGKESMAQSIHNDSDRKDGPFVSVNCTAIPRDLIESELFGYVEGAFTGAKKGGKKGLFELADKGTIFLDEIGDLPLAMQGRLLRVLEEHEIIRVGDDKIIKSDFRVICATNRDLMKMVKEGKFREDLYYRLRVLRLEMPPLRERREDILPLLKLYFERSAPDADFDRCVSAEIQDMLTAYHWPGNIRELRNLAEVLACYEDNPLDAAQLEPYLQEVQPTETDALTIPLGLTLKETESEIVRQILEHYSVDEACAKLGISRVTLWRKTK